ncbi:unannotated protein [freshwater metagenome]|uniref:Unannotated protein n=1 Tax=freshwater metagenome TaxID=449393 RepID=A0A6J7JT79_9ZZZZ
MSGIGKPVKAKGKGAGIACGEAAIGELTGGNGDGVDLHGATVARFEWRCETCHFLFTLFDPCPSVRHPFVHGEEVGSGDHVLRSSRINAMCW